MFCPVCGHSMQQQRARNELRFVCLTHGLMSGKVAVDMLGSPKWHAIAEIRAEQAEREIYSMGYFARCRVRDVWMGYP